MRTSIWFLAGSLAAVVVLAVLVVVLVSSGDKPEAATAEEPTIRESPVPEVRFDPGLEATPTAHAPALATETHPVAAISVADQPVEIEVVDQLGAPRSDVRVAVVYGARGVTPSGGRMGRFTVAGLLDHEIVLGVAELGGPELQFVVEVPKDRSEVVTLVVEREGRLVGTALDEVRHPVVDELLLIEFGNDAMEAVTGAQGEFTLPSRVVQGLTSVRAWGRPGRSEAWRRYSIEPGKIIQMKPLEVELTRCGEARLVPVLPDGGSPSSIDAYLWRLPWATTKRPEPARLELSRDGIVTVPLGCDEPSGRVVRLAWETLRSDCVELRSLNGSLDGTLLHVALRPARLLHVRVIDADDRPIEGCAIACDRDARGILPSSIDLRDGGWRLPRDASYVLTDENGLAEVAEGAATLIACHPLYDQRLVPATDWTEAVLTVHLGRVRTVRGIVKSGSADLSVNDAATARIRLQQEPAADPRESAVVMERWARIGPEGEFAVEGVRPGRATLTVWIAGAEVATANCVIPDSGLEGVEIEVGEALPVRIAFSDECALLAFLRSDRGGVGKTVQLERDGSGAWEGSVGWEGEWTVEMLVDGASAPTPLAVIDVKRDRMHYELAAKLGAIEVRVQQGTLAGEHLGVGAFGKGQVVPAAFRAVDPSGAPISLRCLPGGEYLLVARSSQEFGATADTGDIVGLRRVTVGTELDPMLELSLCPLAESRVLVQDAHGHQLAGASVVFSPEEAPWLSGRAMVTGRDGTTRIRVPIGLAGALTVTTPANGSVRHALPSDDPVPSQLTIRTDS